MGSCCDDHRQLRRCGQPCSPGCTRCRHVTPCLGVADPRGPSRTHLAVVLQGLVRATDPKFRRGHAPVIPYVRTAEPWIRRRRIPPSSCHSLHADNRARASSRTHLRRRVRPPRVQTARLQVRPRVPGTPTRQTPATDGDIPRGRGRVLPARGIRRRRGQQSRPRTRHPSPAAQKCPHTRRMPPAAAPECGGLRGIPSHWCANSTSADVQPRPPGPTQAPEAAKQGKARPAPGEEAPSPEVEAPSRGVRVPDPHRSGWLTPIPATQRVRLGPPGAPGYGHRPAPAHCAGGP